MTIQRITWTFRRGKGWKKWVSLDQTAWVTQLLREPGIVHYGVHREAAGTLNTTPERAMDMIEEEYAS